MHTTLKLPHPAPSTDRYSQPLLNSLSALSTQHAAAALRNWWYRDIDGVRERNGVTVRRALIATDNHDNPRVQAVATFTLSTRDTHDREVLLVIFADGTALILRATSLFTSSYAQSCDEFSVLPIVLRLSSTIRPLDGRPRMILQPRRRTKNAPIVLGIAAASSASSWTDILAKASAAKATISSHDREDLVRDILDETLAWANYLDELPVMMRCKPGQPFEGKLEPEDVLRLKQGSPWKERDDAPTHYALPTAIDHRLFSEEERLAYQAFMISVAFWMSDKIPEINGVHIMIDAAQPSQKPGSRQQPVFSAISVMDRPNSAAKSRDKEFTDVLAAIMKSDLAPIAWNRLVGQEIEHGHGAPLALRPIRVVNVFASGDVNQPSNHQRLSTQVLLDPYWSLTE